MQWLKTWLRKWLGIEQLADRCSIDIAENLKAIRAMALRLELLSQSHQLQADKQAELSSFIQDQSLARLQSFNDLREDLLAVIKDAYDDGQRITQLEILIKDATLDTALLALEDRVAKLEATPIPSGPQGRRGGSAWGPHQAAAAAGAARASGSEVPIPVPGIS